MLFRSEQPTDVILVGASGDFGKEGGAEHLVEALQNAVRSDDRHVRDDPFRTTREFPLQRAVGLPPQHQQTLLAIKGYPEGPPRIVDLAERMQLRHHSMVGLLDRMQEDGLITRSRRPDGRGVAVLMMSTDLSSNASRMSLTNLGLKPCLLATASARTLPIR